MVVRQVGPVKWDLDKVDMPFYNGLVEDPEYFAKEKGFKGHIVYMTPDEYMDMAAKIHGVTRAREYDMVTTGLMKRYAQDMEAGLVFPIPVIDLAINLQEGRHRVAAAQQVGATMVPVLIVERV